MLYKIFIERNTEKKFLKIPKEIRKKIILVISKLKDSPRPLNARKITNSENYYRVRVGDYRVIYEINDKERKIIIFRIRHRREAYLNL